jgi:ketosteroid isomerase-like protein
MRVMPNVSAVVLMGIAACQKPESPAQVQARLDQETAAFRTQMVALAGNYERWTTAGQGDSIAAVFTDGGYELAPNAPPIHGRDGIKAFETQMAAMGSTTIHLSVDEVMASGPVATARGAYEFSLTPAAGAPAGAMAIADTGKWLGTLRQNGAQWQFTALIWNSNIPLPPPPAPAPARRR